MKSQRREILTRWVLCGLRRSETTPSAQPAMIRLRMFQPPTTSVTSAL